MPLDLADALRRHLLQQFPADRDYPRATLHDPAMPTLVAGFLDRALDRWLEIERDGLRSDWFDFDSPAVQEAEARFFGVLARTARVPAEAWEATLGGAIDLVVRFLTVPARALTDALFEGESDPLPTARLRERLRLFAAYLYFPEVAAAYLDKKQPETLDPDTLYDLLDRIDRRIVREYRPGDWLDLLEPLFTLARAVPDFDGIPASLLQDFFAAKGYGAVSDALEPHVGTTVDKDELRQIITAVLDTDEPEPMESETPSDPEPAPKPDTQVEPDAESPELPDESFEDAEGPLAIGRNGEPPEGESSTEAPAASVDDIEAMNGPEQLDDEAPTTRADEHDTDASADENDVTEPLWKRFAGTPDPAPETDGGPEAAPLWKRFATGSEEPLAPPPLDPIEAAAERQLASGTPVPTAPRPAPRPAPVAEVEARVLGPVPGGARARYVKHLFHGDERAYASVLRTLDETESWTDASRVIARDVFRPYKVNIYGEHAVAFTDAVEARFRM